MTVIFSLSSGFYLPPTKLILFLIGIPVFLCMDSIVCLYFEVSFVQVCLFVSSRPMHVLELQLCKLRRRLLLSALFYFRSDVNSVSYIDTSQGGCSISLFLAASRPTDPVCGCAVKNTFLTCKIEEKHMGTSYEAHV